MMGNLTMPCDDVRCENCDTAVRVGLLIKLKDRYCCPYCFHTIKINKKKGAK